jgi:hypothetical protein
LHPGLDQLNCQTRDILAASENHLIFWFPILLTLAAETMACVSFQLNLRGRSAQQMNCIPTNQARAENLKRYLSSAIPQQSHTLRKLNTGRDT